MSVCVVMLSVSWHADVARPQPSASDSIWISSADAELLADRLDSLEIHLAMSLEMLAQRDSVIALKPDCPDLKKEVLVWGLLVSGVAALSMWIGGAVSR